MVYFCRSTKLKARLYNEWRTRSVSRENFKHLCLAVPMIDSYFKEIGRAMYEKLRRSNLTGLASPITIFFPLHVMCHIAGMCTGYGVDIKLTTSSQARRGKSSQEKLIIFIEKEKTSKKLWNFKRIDGTFYLAKRFFKRSNTTKKNEYNGCAKVVVTKYTPI